MCFTFHETKLFGCNKDKSVVLNTMNKVLRSHYDYELYYSGFILDNVLLAFISVLLHINCPI